MRTITINPTNAPEGFVPNEREVLQAQLAACEERHREVYLEAIAASKAKDYKRAQDMRDACTVARKKIFAIEREIKWLTNKERKNGLA